MQLCIVHMVRASLNYVNWKERKQVAADLKAIYRAATAEQAEQELNDVQSPNGDTSTRRSASCGKTTGSG